MNQKNVSSVRIEAATASSLDLLRPLWLTLHRHHQAIAPNLAPYVDNDASWAMRRQFYAECLSHKDSFLFLAYLGEDLVVESELDRLGITDIIIGSLPSNTRTLDMYRRRGFEPTWLVMTRFARRRKTEDVRHARRPANPNQ